MIYLFRYALILVYTVVWGTIGSAGALPADFHFVAKRELAWIPFFGWAMAWSGVGIMVDRRNRARSVSSLRAAAARIRAGANVIILPEGTRTPSGELQAFKSGACGLT